MSTPLRSATAFNMIIGLTGPIASGKSTVCKILKSRGAYIIEADRIGHEVYEPQSSAWHELVKNFGIKILSSGGKINRRKLSEIVFADPQALKTLNRITHPLILERIEKLISQAKKEKHKLIVINAALLKEIGLIPRVDKVWVVIASRENRLKRLMRYKGLSQAQAEARIKIQPAQKYLKIGDFIIKNDKTIKALKRVILTLFPS